MMIMKSNSLHLLLLFLLSSLFLQNQIQAQNQTLISSCSSSWNIPIEQKNYTSGSQYEKDLKNSVIPTLISSVSTSTNGYFNYIYGSSDQDIINSVVQCRPDISIETCKSCLRKSAQQIIQECPNGKTAAIRLDTNCMLKYSSRSPLEQNPIEIKQISNKTQNASNDPIAFNAKVREFLNSLSSSASAKYPKFETGSISIDGSSRNIYGMVQCSDDLQSVNCSNCLSLMTLQLPNCCSNAIGGEVRSIDCFVRYESYKFYQPISSSSSNVFGMNGVSKLLHIVVPVIVGGILLLSGY